MKKFMLLAATLAMMMAAAVPAVAQVGQGNEQEVESGEAGQAFEVTGGGGNSNACSPVQGTNQTGNAANNTGVLQANGDDSEVELEDNGNFGISPSSSIECDQQVNQAASAAAPKAAPAPAPAPKVAPAPAPKPAPAPAPAPKPAPAPPPPPKAEAAAPPPPPPPAPAPKAEEKKAEAKKAEEKKAKEEKKELPKTGGNGTATLFALGAGALLVAGGLVARRIAR